MRYIQVFTVIGEANKRQLVPSIGFRDWEGLHIPFIIFNLIKITGVDVTTQLGDHRGSRYEGERKQTVNT